MRNRKVGRKLTLRSISDMAKMLSCTKDKVERCIKHFGYDQIRTGPRNTKLYNGKQFAVIKAKIGPKERTVQCPTPCGNSHLVNTASSENRTTR